MAIVDRWWMKSYQMWPWLATRGLLISGDIVIISAVLLLPFYPLSSIIYVICHHDTTTGPHTFNESIISSNIKYQKNQIYHFIYSFVVRINWDLKINYRNYRSWPNSSIKAIFIVFLSKLVSMRNHLLCTLAPIVHV